jgi:Flp pilus assembly pilin Flp
MLAIPLLLAVVAALGLAVAARPKLQRDERGAVSLEAAVIAGVLVAGALVVGTILITKATNRANAIPTDSSPVTTAAVP